MAAKHDSSRKTGANHTVPKRVLIVTESLEIGGTEGQIVLLADELVRRGWNVRLFALDSRGALAFGLREAGIDVVNVRCPFSRTAKFRRIIALCQTVLHLIAVCLWSRPEVVHSFLPLPNFLGSIAARLAFVPRVITSKRCLALYQDRHPKMKHLDRLSNTLSDVVVANSHAVAADTIRRDGCSPKKIQITPNGLEFSRFRQMNDLRAAVRRKLGLLDHELGIIKVANFFPYKGHVDLIEAFRLLDRKTSEARLFLVGKDQGMEAHLRERVGFLGLKGKISFLGQRRDIPELLSAMDVAVLSSYEEGLSNALLEKLAVGLPVVTTDVAANAEAIEGMPNCRLVRPRDPEDLAKGLSEVIDIIRRGDNGREMRRKLIEERHSVERMVDAYERLYLGQAPHPAVATYAVGRSEA